MQTKLAYVHIVDDGDRVLVKKQVNAVPRVGDVIRVSTDKFYVVELVVWCMDEEYHGLQRVNIGVTKEKNHE